MTQYNGIEIDYSRDDLLEEFGLTLLKEKYLKNNEKSPQEAYARTAVAFCGGDLELAQRIYDYVSKRYVGFASPVLSNSTYAGEPIKSLPISCFASMAPDNLQGLIDHSSEIRWLTVMGGGTAGHWSSIRAVSDKAPGPIPFIKTLDADIDAYAQGKTRRGSYAAYLDVSHPDIMEFIKLRVPTGDASRKCNSVGFHNAVNISDAFMKAVKENSDWPLIDPHSKEVRDIVKARELWQEILITRHRTGEPYLTFIDTANRALPIYQRKKGLSIKGSNLCNEIYLPTDEERSFVCCLSSLNAEMYREWYDTNIVEDLVTFLDNVIQVFIDNCPPQLSKSKYSAMMERALGLGVMGLHSLYQKEFIPFESKEAFDLNNELFALIKDRATLQTYKLAQERGEPEDCKGTGRRNSHLLAVAPTANNAIIIGTSPSIEPQPANVYLQKTRIGSFVVKNKFLKEHLAKLGLDTEETWKSITINDGSVQHLDIPDDVKAVFRTAIETDQMAIVEQAGERQKYICQGQSLNLFFKAETTKKYFREVHERAFEVGCKGLYYVRAKTKNSVRAASTKQERQKIDVEPESCEACQ